MRMSQMAASVESRGMNLMQSLLFLKACSSEGETPASVWDRTATLGLPSSFMGLHTCVHRLLDGNEAHR